MSQAALSTDGSTVVGTHMALELSRKTWKLGFSDGTARPVRVVTVPARELTQVDAQIARAKQRFELPPETAVRSCYEAGRDGFWVHRALTTLGVENLVVDPASIEVNRRRRRAKTDRLDAVKLVTQLVRHYRGEKVWSVVRVPEIPDEDARQLHRELQVLRAQRRNHRMRIQSLLFTQGVDLKVGSRFLEQLPRLQCWNGAELPGMLRGRLVREHQRLQQVEEQIRELEGTRQALLDSVHTKSIERARLLAQLCGIGIASSWVFVMEFFGWRRFRNRREVAAAAGLTPTPFSSGDSPWEQGISKAGNPRVRALMIEIAWSWLRYQPESELARWFWQRFGHGSGRMRRVGIVALARRHWSTCGGSWSSAWSPTGRGSRPPSRSRPEQHHVDESSCSGWWRRPEPSGGSLRTPVFLDGVVSIHRFAKRLERIAASGARSRPTRIEVGREDNLANSGTGQPSCSDSLKEARKRNGG